MLRRIHLIVGLTGVVLFLASGQYMDRVHDHLRGMDDVRRMLFRSAHIYLLWSSLLNLALGLHLSEAPSAWRRVLQWVGSALLLAGPPLLILAFLREPWLTDLDRPFAGPAIYAALAGMLAHLAGRAASTTWSEIGVETERVALTDQLAAKDRRSPASPP